MIRALSAGLVAAVVIAAAGAVRAQDPTARYDIDDVLGRHPHNVEELPTEEEARGRRITFELSVAGTYATNAGTTRFNAIDAGYVTPGLGLNVTPVNLGGWDLGGGALLDADYYGGGHDDQFGEGRLEGFVFASHALGPGSFTAEVIAIGIFGNDFSKQELNLLITDLTYSMKIGGLELETSVEYQDSDIAELRRGRLTGTIGHTLGERLLGYQVTLEGDLAVSDFTSGASSGRQDATAALVLIAERDLAAGWSLEWEAAVVRRFSNRPDFAFSALDLGVEVVRAF